MVFGEERMNSKLNYDKLMKELESGKTMVQLSKELKKDYNTLRRNLKKRFPERYKKCIYGEIIGESKGYKLYKIPKKTIGLNETDVTKITKQILIARHEGIEEVGVWLNNFRSKVVIDIYVPKQKMGIEVYYANPKTYKELLKKLERYRKYFCKVIVALACDSSRRRTSRTFPVLKQKLKEDGFNYIVVDISRVYPLQYDRKSNAPHKVDSFISCGTD